jgi:prolipoprotein diacylglyceryltransferase
MKSPTAMRLFLFPCEILWIIYAIVSGNIPLIISESFLLFSAILGVVRSIVEHYRNKKANAVQEIEKQNE